VNGIMIASEQIDQIELPSFPNGDNTHPYNISVIIGDEAGNNTSENISWIFDTTPPQVTSFTSTLEGVYYDSGTIISDLWQSVPGNIEFTYTDELSDISRIEYTVTGADPVSTVSYLVNAPSGVRTIRTPEIKGSSHYTVRAYDAFENYSEATGYFYYDDTPPTLYVNDHTTDWINTNTSWWIVAADDESYVQTIRAPIYVEYWNEATQKFEYQWEIQEYHFSDQQYAVQEWVLFPENLPSKTLSQNLEVTAVNHAGVEIAAPMVYEINYDGEAPSILPEEVRWSDGSQDIDLVETYLFESIKAIVPNVTEGSPIVNYYLYTTPDPTLTMDQVFPGPEALAVVPSNLEHEIIFDLVDGENFLFLRREDAAGNISEWERFRLYVDRQAPSAPVINSATHPNAQNFNDAVAEEAATFTFEVTESGTSAISHYDWELRITQDPTQDSNDDSIRSDMSLTAALTLDPLPDNVGNEYYQLFVWAVAENGVKSEAGIYNFRIDATAPENVNLILTPQSEPSSVYSNPDVNLSWLAPTDVSGIKAIYYTTSEAPITLPLSGAEIPADWKKVPVTGADDYSVTLAVSDVLTEELLAGEVYVALAVEDFAGSVTADQKSFLYDFGLPTVDEVPAHPDADGKEILATWNDSQGIWNITFGDFTDAESGVSHYEVLIQEVDELGATIEVSNQSLSFVSNFETGLDFNSSDAQKLYSITLQVIDQAGNASTSFKKFFSANPDVVYPEDIVEDLYYEWGEFILTGKVTTRLTDGVKDYSELQLSVPPGFPMTTFSPQTMVHSQIGTLNLQPQTGLAGGTFTLTGADVFHAVVNGHVVASKTLTFTIDRGLSLVNVMVPLEDSEGTDTTVLNFSEVLFESLTELRIQSSSIANIPGENTVLVSTDNEGTTPVPAFRLLETVSASMRGETLNLIGAQLDLSFLSQDDPPAATLVTEEVMLHGDNSIAFGPILPDQVMSVKNNSYTLQEARLQGNWLEVAESTLDLPLGSTPNKIPIYDYKVNYKGEWAKGPGFSHPPFIYEYTNAQGIDVTINVQGLDILVDGTLVIKSGVATWGVDNAVNITDLTIEETGVDLEGRGQLTGFKPVIQGWTIEVEDSQFMADSILIHAGRIKLPANMSNRTIIIRDLEIGYQTPEGLWPIIRSGATDLMSAPLVFNPMGYGKNASLNQFVFNEKGLSIPSLELELPAVINEDFLTFTDLVVNQEGVLRSSGAGNDLQLHYSSFDLDFTNVGFGEDGISFEGLVIPLTLAEGSHQLLFPEGSLTGAGFSQRLEALNLVPYSKNGWQIPLENVGIDNSGITGQGRLRLPSSLGGLDVLFDEVKIVDPSSITTSTSQEGFLARVHGWITVLADPEITAEGNLQFASAEVPLYPTMGSEKLLINNVIFNTNGEVQNSNSSGQSVSFLSENGYKVDGNSFTFTPDGLRLGGAVHFPKGLGEENSVTFPSGDILLDGNGVILTEEFTGTTEYKFAAFTVEASNIQYDYGGMRIGHNNFQFMVFENPVEFNIGELMFYSDGRIKTGGNAFEGFEVGSNQEGAFYLSVNELWLDDDGLNLSAFIQLPSVVGGASVYFNKLTLDSYGRLSSDSTVPYLQFTLFDTLFEFEYIRFSNDVGFSIADATITLPEAMNNKQFFVSNISIDSNGNINMNASGFDPVELFGFTFLLDSLKVSKNIDQYDNDLVFTLDGYVLLPSSLPSPFGGRRVAIDTFVISAEGELKEFTVTMTGEYDFEFMPGWFLTAKEPFVNHTKNQNNEDVFVFGLASGKLAFPENFLDGEEWSVESAELYDIQFNTDTGKVTIGGGNITKLKANIFDIDFSFDEIEVLNEDGGFSFALKNGSAIFPDRTMEEDGKKPWPEFIRGKELTVHKLAINPDGTIGALDVELTTPIKEYLATGVLLELNDVRLGYYEDKFILGMEDASILLEEGHFPEGIGGSKLTVNEFAFETNTGNLLQLDATLGQYTDLSSTKIFTENGQEILYVVDEEGNKALDEEGNAIRVDPLTFTLFDTLEVSEGLLGLKYIPEDESFDIWAGGNLKLTGEAFPETLKDKTIKISDFRINTEEGMKAFKAGLIVDTKTPLFGDNIYISGDEKPFSIDVGYVKDTDSVEVRLTGQELPDGSMDYAEIVFSDQVIDPFKNQRIQLTTFIYDTAGGFVDVDLSMAFTEGFFIGDTVEIKKDSEIYIEDFSSSELVIGVRGSVLLPHEIGGTNPDLGEDKKEIIINHFEFGTSLQVRKIDIVSSPLDLKLFDDSLLISDLVLSIKESYPVIENLPEGEMPPMGFSFSAQNATVSLLGDNIPDELKTASLTLHNLSVSTNDLSDIQFSITLNKDIPIPLFGGMEVIIKTLGVSNNGFSTSGVVEWPTSVPILSDLPAATVALGMDWDGNLTYINGGMANIELDLFGVILKSSAITFSKDGVVLANDTTITLPEIFALENNTFGFAPDPVLDYVGFDNQFNFVGSVIISNLTWDLAGFTVVLNQPNLDLQAGKLAFESAKIQLPSFISGTEDTAEDGEAEGMSATLSKATIDANGLSFESAKFVMPTFSVPGGMEFALTGEVIRVNEGEEDPYTGKMAANTYYIVAGDGYANIPGLGKLTARAAFAEKNTSNKYGISEAYFSYMVEGLGLPIFSSGLFINGIEGGFKYGNTSDVPEAVQGYFSADNARLMLGVYIQDATMGTLIKGNVRFWIDITNFDWAIQGKATILSGLIKSELLASYAGGVFMGDLKIQLSFLRGQATIYIWREDGELLVSGKANARIVLQKGAIAHWSWKVWFLPRIHVYIPPGTWDPGIELGVEFGQFKKGRSRVSGFKGYAELPFLGNTGFFVTRRGKFSFGNVSNYVLYFPTRSGVMMPFRGPITGDPQRVIVHEDNHFVTTGTNEYFFNVPNGQPSDLPANTRSTLGQTKSIFRNSTGEEVAEPLQIEKIIYILSYNEGDPELVLTSPSEGVYTESHEDVTVTRMSWGHVVTLETNEGGDWKAEVVGVPEGTEIDMKVMGKAMPPVISLNAPVAESTQDGTAYRIEGSVVHYTTKTPELNIYTSTDSNVEQEHHLGRATIQEDGTFSLLVSAKKFPLGENYVYAVIDDEVNIIKPQFRADPILIELENSLIAPDEVIAVVLEEGRIQLNFTSHNNLWKKGSRVLIKEVGVDNEGDYDAGHEVELAHMEQTEISGIAPYREVEILDANQEVIDVQREYIQYYLQVYDYDLAENNGPFSEKLEFRFDETPRIENPFIVRNTQDHYDMVVGYNGEITLEVELINNPVRTRRGYDLLRLEKVAGPTWFELNPYNSDHRLVPDLETTVAQYTVDFGTRLGDASTNFKPVQPPAGVYPVTLRAFSLGNQEIYQDIDINVEIIYPELIIDVVEPAVWNAGETPELVIEGAGFTDGLRVYLKQGSTESTELSITQPNDGEILTTVPRELAQGDYTIELVRVDGSTTSAPVSVAYPFYTVSLYDSALEVKAGNSISLPFEVTGHHGFGTGPSDFAEITPSSIPSGFYATEQVYVAPGDGGKLVISPDSGVSVGDYTLTFRTNQNDLFDINVSVKANEAVLKPQLVNISDVTVEIGQTVVLDGYHLGTEGIITIGGAEQSVLPGDWTNDQVIFTVVEGTMDGELILTNSAGTTQLEHPLMIFVIDEGFDFLPVNTNLEMRAGDVQEVVVSTQGLPNPIELYLGYIPPVFDVSIDTTEITPHVDPAQNPTVTVTITALADIYNGDYSFSLLGTSGSHLRDLQFNISVSEVYTMEEDTLPIGMENAYYSGEVKTLNGFAPFTYELTAESGPLPPGLSLEPNTGIISGTPEGFGSFDFTVISTDTVGQEAVMSFTLTIEPDAWIGPDKDGGNTNSTESGIPAVATNLWENATGYTQGQLIGNHQYLYIVGDTSLAAFDRLTGEKIWEAMDDSQKTLYVGGLIFTLDNTGLLIARNGAHGNVVWTERGVTRFSSDGSRLSIQSDSGMDLYHVVEGGAVAYAGPWAAREANMVNIDQGFWSRTQMFFWENTGIQGLNDNHDYFGPYSDPIIEVLDDGQGRLIQTTKELLYQAGESNTWQLPWENIHSLSMSDDFIAVLDEREGSRYLSILDRGTGSLKAHSALEANSVTLTKEKAFAVADTGVVVLNIWTMQELYRIDGAVVEAIAVADGLYVLGSDGVLRGYEGAHNLLPPVTEILSVPAEPDGKLGYFITSPLVNVRATDPESFATGSFYKLNDAAAFQEEVGPISLGDGYQQVWAYSKDSQGLRSEEVYRTFMVDSTPPALVTEINGTQDKLDYYQDSVLLSAIATDDGSGLEDIVYTIDGNELFYVEPISISGEGPHNIEIYAKDMAGNISESESLSFVIDLTAPTMDSSLFLDPNIALLELRSLDTGSGVDRIEYQVNNDGLWLTYSEAVVFNQPGSYEVTFRAFDNAGRQSLLKKRVFSLTERVVGELYLLSEDPQYVDRVTSVVDDLQVGAKVYDYHPFLVNQITALPASLIGAKMLRTSPLMTESTVGPYYEFEASDSITVHLAVPAGHSEPGDGWTAIEGSYMLESGEIFSNGVDIYMKHFVVNEMVAIPQLTNPFEPPPLIFVSQPEESLLTIFSPRRRGYMEIMPSEEVHFKALAHYPQAGIELKYEYRTADNGMSWVDIPDGVYTAPATINFDVDGDFRVSLVDENGVIVGAVIMPIKFVATYSLEMM
jgi:hypothetical protein